MESLHYNNFNMEDTTSMNNANVSENQVTPATVNNSDNYAPKDSRSMSKTESGFSPLAPSFQSRIGNEFHNMLNQEPRHADKAPSTAEMDDVLLNFRMNGSENIFDNVDSNSPNYYLGNNNTESGGSTHSNIWSDNSSMTTGPNEGVLDTVDFVVKSLSSADYYVSMLTREQVSVMRSIRPGLLYELLLEVAKVRNDKRQRRALPNECAFCKNNGEIEECYSSHALKDWRGRVLCPVLRAFRCPRCGATGDRAHTIKYCPENADAVSERLGHGPLGARRRIPPSQLLGGRAPPPAPTPSPTATPLSHPSIWSTFGMN